MTPNESTLMLQSVAASAGHAWMREATEDAAARSLDCLGALGTELLDSLQTAPETDADRARWFAAEDAMFYLTMLGVVSVEDLRALDALHAWAESVSQRDLPNPVHPLLAAYVFRTRQPSPWATQ